MLPQQTVSTRLGIPQGLTQESGQSHVESMVISSRPSTTELQKCCMSDRHLPERLPGCSLAVLPSFENSLILGPWSVDSLNGGSTNELKIAPVHNNTILNSIVSAHCGHDCKYGTDEADIFSGKCAGFPAPDKFIQNILICQCYLKQTLCLSKK